MGRADENGTVTLAEAVALCGRRRAALARDLGVAQSTVNRWISGECRVPAVRAVQLACLLGYRVEDIRWPG